MLFGAHVSIAGGVQNAPLHARKIGCEVFQMFSRSPQGGPAPKLTPNIVEAFRKNCEDGQFFEWVIHAPYYINFASNEERIRKSTIRVIREELERGSILGAAYVMFHPGSARDVGEHVAMKFCVEGIARVLDGYDGTTKLLIEMSAGAGMVIGDTFEELAELLDGVNHPELGICFDTAHAFASGYDLRDTQTVEKTFKQFDKSIGLKRLKMSHCNDSKVGLGARRDRHEHLGDGFIGLDGFRAMVALKKLQHVNLYCETEPGGVEKDLKALKKMRRLSELRRLEKKMAEQLEKARGVLAQLRSRFDSRPPGEHKLRMGEKISNLREVIARIEAALSRLQKHIGKVRGYLDECRAELEGTASDLALMEEADTILRNADTSMDQVDETILTSLVALETRLTSLRDQTRTLFGEIADTRFSSTEQLAQDLSVFEQLVESGLQEPALLKMQGKAPSPT